MRVNRLPGVIPSILVAGLIVLAAPYLWTTLPTDRMDRSNRVGLSAPFGQGIDNASGDERDQGKVSPIGVLPSMPLVFEENVGQTDPGVRFLARVAGATLFLTSNDLVLMPCGAGEADDATACEAVRMSLVGASPLPEVVGIDPLPGVSNYFIGSDPSSWRTGVPHYARVHYAQVYPGIDLVFYSNGGQLEFDFVVAPGVDPTVIGLSFSGVREVAIEEDGDLVVTTTTGELLQHAPIVYQESNGLRRTVQGGYELREDSSVGFWAAKYDESRTLVIDPKLFYSTYLGGTGDDTGEGIAVDSHGNAYVAGETDSAGFPTVDALDGVIGGTTGEKDAFIAKLAPGGGTLLFATYLGGSRGDVAHDIALDSEGNIYLTGYTSSEDFPTIDSLQDDIASVGDAFVAKMDPSGSALVYSSFLGGSSYDWGKSITVDDNGYILVSGDTRSTDFPTWSPLQGALGGSDDVFITKFPATVAYYYWSTYLGGSDEEEVAAIAADSAGNVYVTGRSYSSDFPTSNAAQPSFGGGSQDAFVAQLHLMGWSFGYSTFVGGGDRDSGHDIWVDRGHSAYVACSTSSTDFPTVNAYQPENAGLRDAAVTKFTPDGSLALSTYLGGSSDEYGQGIRTDESGSVYVAGSTRSTNFPTKYALQGERQGSNDLFVAQMTPGAQDLIWSTYLGGTGSEGIWGFFVDERGAVYVTGRTFSTDFPTVGPVQLAHGGGDQDVFIAKLATALDFFIAATPLLGRATAVDQQP